MLDGKVICNENACKKNVPAKSPLNNISLLKVPREESVKENLRNMVTKYCREKVIKKQNEAKTLMGDDPRRADLYNEACEVYRSWKCMKEWLSNVILQNILA